MSDLLQRFGGFLPSVIALTLPLVFLPNLSDTYILPRTSIAITGACVGVGLALLAPGGGRLGALRLPLLAAGVAAVVAFAFSISWPLSTAGSYTRYESLPVRLSYLGLAASAVWLLRTRLQRDAVVAGFVFGVSTASLEAIQQAFAHVAFRPDGNLGNANLLAALIAMGIPLAADRARRFGLFVLPWAAAIVVMSAGLVATTSRSGALGVIAGCLALLTLAVPRRWSPVVGIASVLLVVGSVLFILLSPLRALNDDPASLRLSLWRDGLKLVLARPLTGWGEDTTGLSFGRFLTRDYAGLVTFDRIHSGPLDVAATQGLIGLAAITWVLVVIGIAAWRRREDRDVQGLAAALVGFTVWVFFNFDWAPATAAFWLLAGTLWSAASPVPGPAIKAPQPGLLSEVGALGLVLVAVAFAVLPILADNWYLKGRPDLAVRVAPLQAQYRWALGTVQDLRTAADLGQTEPSMYVQLGDLERQHGDVAAAKRAYQRALEIDPFYRPAAQRIAALNG